PVADPESAKRLAYEAQVAMNPNRSKLARLSDVANTEAYAPIVENEFIATVGENARSTFSTDVDTASYANVRRFLNQNQIPPPGAVRIEELVNYFRYDYAPPKDDKPFATHLEIAECPWNPKHRLARIGLKGKIVDDSKRPASNLVFLVDISGSMDDPKKLPLVKQSLNLLVDKLGENDKIAIAVYANGSGLALDGTSGAKKAEIKYALDSLQPSGSTNGAAGIKIAYETAVKNFVKGGINRVILCTDGDFNVGASSDDELVSLITEKAKSGVFLSVLGYGMGNLKDQKMVQLSGKGNGNYAYIDTVKEAEKVLVEQMSGTLMTIAKDVKIQVEFNPAKVAAYRLVGYEKRLLKNEDFKDDKKDAGEIGAGHTVTCLYELVPAGAPNPARTVDPMVFQDTPGRIKDDASLAKLSMMVKLRYKKPDGDVSTEIFYPGVDEGKSFGKASTDYQFAATVASFGMLLRDSKNKGNATWGSVLEMADAAQGADAGGYRKEFLGMVRKAKELATAK
ncbi:MAG TPA: VWA domain-containing protein, partial [Planctomycetia bacterium]|nr:VWA domain-containing protein [Planctomycetia bacterium]